MLQSPVSQSPARSSESFGAARRSLLGMVVRTPMMWHQSAITILLPDGWRWRWNYTTECFFGLFMVANEPTAHRVPRCLCLVTSATFPWMTSSHLWLRIWSTMSGRDRMMILRRGAQIQEASQCRKPASKHSNGIFKGILSDSSNTLMSSKTVLLVSLLFTSKVLFLIRMWLGCMSTITLWILPLRTHWPKECVVAAAWLQISRCEDGMHWMHDCQKISFVRGYFCSTLAGGQMGDNLEFFWRGCQCLFGVLYILLLHRLYSCMKGCVESSRCWA